MSRPIVELKGITKWYPGVVANENVDLNVRAGTVHAVIGENGAGKSTLMRILYGMVVPDSGSIVVDGVQTSMASPSDAIEVGIGMVHQHFKLADNLTVLENIILGSEPTTRGGRIDFSAARHRIEELGTRYRIPVPPDVLAADLSVGNRQRVEILKVLYRGARILILDEPTAVLVPQEVEELLSNLRELVQGGLTVVFISHKLDEVLSVADEITVMRAGRTVASTTPDQITARDLAKLMVGSELPEPATRSSEVRPDVALEILGLDVPPQEHEMGLQGIDLKVHAGEIVGIAGVEGNGQRELIDAILGVKSVSAGSIRFEDRDMTEESTAERRRMGLRYIPQDRHRDGLLLGAGLWENRVLGYQMLPPINTGPWISRRVARAETKQLVDGSDVRTPNIDILASALSGGNQQKFIVGREMSDGVRILIAAHPTRGVDVGAQAAIWERLTAVRVSGVAVVLVSSNLEEIIGLSDRVLVILRGSFVAELDPTNLTPEDLGAAMTGVEVS